jgi:simple sugar transport system ATP-binding protein
MAVADRVTVMRHGRVVGEVATGQTDQRALARLMVGRDVMFDIARGEAEPGRPMVELEDVRALNDRGLLALDGASFAVRAGEVLGVAGVDGNGQTELAEVIAGLRPLRGGRIRVGGQDITGASVAERKHRLRIGYVPEDRQRTGLVLDQSVGLNLILRNYRRRPFARYGFLDFGRVRGHAERLVRRYDVRLRDVDQTARYLSGGNQQKLILAREIEDDPAVLVVAQPTKGLDVGAIEFVQRTLLEQRRRGVAILYISTEIEHLMAVSDRVGVLFRGRLAGPFPVEAVTPDRLGMLMAGVAA